MSDSEWHPSACILCECNCGIEIRLGADGHTFERIRGDKAHPASQGYTCEKALRLNHYQNGGDRLLAPLRKRPDGSFEEIDWETAIREIADRFAAVRDAHGGESIFYYGGGGQGNHLGGGYSGATLRALKDAGFSLILDDFGSTARCSAAACAPTSSIARWHCSWARTHGRATAFRVPAPR